MRAVATPGLTFAAIVLACPLLAEVAQAEWGTYQGNAAHTGYVPGTLDLSRAALKWRTPVSSYLPMGLAVGGNTVFVNTAASYTSGNGLVALDQSSGGVLWSKAYGSSSGAIGAPAYANGTAYVQCASAVAGSYLHAYTARTGTSVYDAQYAAQWQSYLNPTPFEGNIYTPGGYLGGVYSFNAATGQQNWFGQATSSQGWTPAVDANYCYSFTRSDSSPTHGQFRMINRNTGVTSYLVTDTSFQDTGYSMNSAVVLGTHSNAFSVNGPGYVGSTPVSTGRLIMWDLRDDSGLTPHIGWTITDHFSGQPTLANGVLYANNGGSLAALDELTGQSLWSWTPPSGKLTGAMIATDNVLLASTARMTYAIDLNSHGAIWSYPMGGMLALSDGTLYITGSYIAGTDQAVYAVTLPEPVTFSLLAVGLACIRRRRRKRFVAPAGEVVEGTLIRAVHERVPGADQ